MHFKGVARSTGFGLAEAVGAAAAASPEPPPAAAPCEPPAAAEPREPAEEAAPADGDLLELGVFGAPHGLGGELRLALITDAPEQRLGAPGRLWVRPRTGWTRERGRGPPQPVWLEAGRPTTVKGRPTWLLKLRGVDAPEAAEQLRGLFLLGDAAARPPLDGDDEFYVQELVGMAVVLQASGEAIGTVVDLYDGTGAHDVLRVRLEGPRCPDDGVDAPRTMLLPFARAFAPVVDRVARRMEVAPPPGLLEAALEPRLPKKEKKGQRRPRLRPSRQGDEERGGAAGGEGAGARGGEGRGARRREDGGARGAEAERARP